MKTVKVICGKEEINVPMEIWKEVMITMAWQMEDDYSDYARNLGLKRPTIDKVLDTYTQLSRLGN